MSTKAEEIAAAKSRLLNDVQQMVRLDEDCWKLDAVYWLSNDEIIETINLKLKDLILWCNFTLKPVLIEAQISPQIFKKKFKMLIDILEEITVNELKKKETTVEEEEKKETAVEKEEKKETAVEEEAIIINEKRLDILTNGDQHENMENVEGANTNCLKNISLNVENVKEEISIDPIRCLDLNWYRCLACKKILDTQSKNDHGHEVHPDEKHAIKAYVEFWSTLPNKLDQFFFWPVDSNRQECMACEILQLNKNMRIHMASDTHKANIIDYECPQESILQQFSNEFYNKMCSSKKNGHVHPAVKLMFPSEYKMQIGEETTLCLVCNSTKNNHEHTKLSRSEKQSIQNFHINWSTLPLDVQLQQIYFRPTMDVDELACEVCKLKLQTGSVLEHIYGYKHDIGKWHKETRIKMLTFETEPYPQGLYQLIQKRHPNDAAVKSIQQIGINEYRCLSCYTELKTHTLFPHLKSDDHKKQTKLYKISLEEYNSYWESNDKKQMVKYIPHKNKHVQCESCSDVIPFHAIQTHSHGNLFTLARYYPLSLLQELQTLEGKMSRNVQMLSENKYRCLICRVITTNVANHVKTYTQHQLFALDLSHKAALQFFHSLWADVDLELQAFQNIFYPNSSDSIICELCSILIPGKKALLEHLEKHSKEEIKKTPRNKTHNANEKERSSEINNIEADASNSTSSNEGNKIGLRLETRADLSSKVLKTIRFKSLSQLKKMGGILTKEDIHDNEVLFQKIWKSLPIRFSINKDYIFYLNKMLKCTLCDCPVDVEQIKIHILTKAHRKNTKQRGPRSNYIPWDSLRYSCMFCKVFLKDETEWETHLKQTDHVILSDPKVTEPKFSDDFCFVCALVMFGTQQMVLSHEHTPVKPKECKLSPRLLLHLKSHDNLKDFVETLTVKALNAMKNTEPDKHCMGRILSLVQSKYPNAAVYAFGSRVSGLGNEKSDLDVFLDTGDMYNGNQKQDPLSQERIVDYLCTVLTKKEVKHEWKKLVPVPFARTPIVKIYHRPTQLDCDISFRHGLSVENTKLLCLYFKYQPITRPLILFLKFWSNQCSLDHKLSSYALSMMVIYFMQTLNFLPSVMELRKSFTGKPKKIAGWDCSFSLDIDYLRKHKPFKCDLSFVELLIKFFEFQIAFDHSEWVMCPLLGYPLKKSDFTLVNERTTRQSLPPEMDSYVERVWSGNPDEVNCFRSLADLCIQDPFDLEHNLTKAISSAQVQRFKRFCELSLETLKTDASLENGKRGQSKKFVLLDGQLEMMRAQVYENLWKMYTLYTLVFMQIQEHNPKSSPERARRLSSKIRRGQKDLE